MSKGQSWGQAEFTLMEERRACGQTGRPGETLQAAGRAQREPEIHTDRTAPGVQSTGLLRRCGAHTSLYPEVGGLGRGAAPAREGGSERASEGPNNSRPSPPGRRRVGWRGKEERPAANRHGGACAVLE